MNDTKIDVKRRWYSERSTIGEMFFDGDFVCYTLEDPVRQLKIPGETAIPEGTYEVIINYSNRFKQMMPLLLNVQNFVGVRIHSGNKPDQTEGCLLVGRTKDTASDFVGESRLAYVTVLNLIKEAMQRGKVFLTIKNIPTDGQTS